MNDKIRNSDDVLPYIQKYSKYRQEHFGLICLNSERKVTFCKVLFIGAEHGTVVYPKILFWKACEKKASDIIVFHNHPSQNTQP